MSENGPVTEGAVSRSLEEKIVSEAPRLGPDDAFQFGCHPCIACFTHCCADVNVFLSPYDVLRMKRRLGLTSGEFLDKYATLLVEKGMRTPVVILRMGDDEAKSCPFLGEEGCGIYTDRPWPCRMYPLGLAAQRDTADGWRGEQFHYLLREDGCLGHEEGQQWTVRKWLEDQRLEEYDEWGEAYKELTLHSFFDDGGVLSPERMEMLFTACYDLDRFRGFVFDSSLLDRFEVDDDLVDEMRESDEALLRFGFLWLRFALFGEKTMRVREEAVIALREKAGQKPAPARVAGGNGEVDPA